MCFRKVHCSWRIAFHYWRSYTLGMLPVVPSNYFSDNHFFFLDILIWYATLLQGGVEMVKFNIKCRSLKLLLSLFLHTESWNFPDLFINYVFFRSILFCCLRFYSYYAEPLVNSKQRNVSETILCPVSKTIITAWIELGWYLLNVDIFRYLFVAIWFYSDNLKIWKSNSNTLTVFFANYNLHHLS